MKPKILFWVIVIFVITGLALFGYFRATKPAKNQKNLPKIEITPKSFEFGEVEYGQVLNHTFQVKNNGKAILKIKRVATSCGCTTARVAKKNLGPNEKTNLFVRYDTGAMSGHHGKGKQERIIFIQNNDPVNPQVELTIYANVQ